MFLKNRNNRIILTGILQILTFATCVYLFISPISIPVKIFAIFFIIIIDIMYFFVLLSFMNKNPYIIDTAF